MSSIRLLMAFQLLTPPLAIVIVIAIEIRFVALFSFLDRHILLWIFGTPRALFGRLRGSLCMR